MNGGLVQSTSSLFSSCQQLSSGEITVVFFFLEVSNDVHGLCFFWHQPFHETMECSSGVTIHELSFYNNLSYYWLSERKGNKTASSVPVSFRRINLIRSPVWFPLPSGVFPATYWPHLSPWCQSLSFVGLFLCISMLSPRTCVYVCVRERDHIFLEARL